MTDLTDTIETTAASIEDLQEDLEAHLEDMFGFGVTVEAGDIRHDDWKGHSLQVDVEIEPLERELQRRLDADEVWTRGFSLEVVPTVPDEQRESDIEAGVRDMAREEAEDVVQESTGDPE